MRVIKVFNMNILRAKHQRETIANVTKVKDFLSSSHK